jgi:hypothetical protein
MEFWQSPTTALQYLALGEWLVAALCSPLYFVISDNTLITLQQLSDNSTPPTFKQHSNNTPTFLTTP